MKSSAIVEQILNGVDVRKLLAEDADTEYVADTDYAERMVRAWLDHTAYDYIIKNVEVIGNDEVKVTFCERYSSPSYIIVTNDGMYNSNGDDIVEISLEAFADNPAEIRWTRNFKSKWY